MSDFKNLEAIWAPMSEILKSKHVDTAYNLWFGDMEFVSLTSKEAMFTTTNNLKRDVILENFAEEMQDALCSIVNYRPRIVIISTENEEIDLSAPKLEHFKKVELGEATADDIVMPDDYRSDYTFDNFIVGASNEFAYAAARAVSEKDLDDPETLRSNAYNPLFIYGPSGVGKTHLLYAITNKLAKRYPSKKIVYIKGEEFTNQLVEAIRNKTTFEFREKFRRVDVLLIDDIQFVAGRDSTQLEVFNTFNAVYEERKQIILTSDRPPNEIKTLEERLRTRFLSGLLADVSLPDFDLRLAILQQKAKQNNIYLSSEILKYIADNVSSSIRQLEGIIKKLGAIKFLQGGELSFDRVKDAIKDFVQVKENESKKFDEILMAVSTKFGISREDILSEKRKKDIAMARHICVYIARELTSLSQTQIAKILNRDRSTLVSSEKAVKDAMEKDSDFAFDIKEIIRELSN
ncbi:MAG: chromosomal replication initiator protein DnaA [Ruminococcaceae bacterium]|nr:chromosomal replication initiator protein DnaA [Oscillospiraceae bacterium]